MPRLKDKYISIYWSVKLLLRSKKRTNLLSRPLTKYQSQSNWRYKPKVKVQILPITINHFSIWKITRPKPWMVKIWIANPQPKYLPFMAYGLVIFMTNWKDYRHLKNYWTINHAWGDLCHKSLQFKVYGRVTSL